MIITSNIVATIGAAYLLGLVEFAIWCHQAPISPEANASGE